MKNKNGQAERCKCVSLVNERLRANNAEIDTALSVSGAVWPRISLVKRDRTIRKALPILIPTFCPFCGKTYGSKTGERGRIYL